MHKIPPAVVSDVLAFSSGRMSTASLAIFSLLLVAAGLALFSWLRSNLSRKPKRRHTPENKGV